MEHMKINDKLGRKKCLMKICVRDTNGKVSLLVPFNRLEITVNLYYNLG